VRLLRVLLGVVDEALGRIGHLARRIEQPLAVACQPSKIRDLNQTIERRVH
jgi:hypothetical protein